MLGLLGGLGPALLIVNSCLAFLGCVVVGLRAYSARSRNGRLRWDFIWIVLALIFSLVNAICIGFATYNGLGRHIGDLELDQLFIVVHWLWITMIVSLPGTVFAKFSIVSLLLQIQGSQARKRRMALLIIAVLTAVISFTQIWLSVFQCEPINKLWQLFEPGQCPRSDGSTYFGIFQGSYSAFVDLVGAAWPISVVWHLQISKRAKCSFCLLMGLSVLPCIAAIRRTVMIKLLPTSADPPYEFAKFIIWGVLETWAIIILGSIPPLRPLFLRMLGKHPTQLNSDWTTTVPTNRWSKPIPNITTITVDDGV